MYMRKLVEFVHIFSFVAAPTEPLSLRVRLASSSPPTAEVTWQPPRQSFGDINGYKLTYFVLDGDADTTQDMRIKPEERRLVTNSLSKRSQSARVLYCEC